MRSPQSPHAALRAVLFLAVFAAAAAAEASMTMYGPSAPVASGTSYNISAVSSFPGGPNLPTTYLYKNGQLVAQATMSASYSSTDVGPATITYSASSSYGSATLVVTILAPNTAPTISDIVDRSISEDGTTGAVAFTVGDAQTAAGSLTVTATSSNTTLLPNNRITLGGSGASRSITALPALNQHGTTIVTVSVSDGLLSASDTFTLTVNPVNDAPTISSLSVPSIAEDASAGPVAFTVGDVETAAGSLTVTRSSSNTTLLPLSGIVLGGSGASRNVSLTPAANQHGSATVTLTVSDGSATATTSFTLTVNPVNDAPTISSLSVPSIAEDASAGPVAFTVGDVETAAGSLTVTRSSSNTTLLPLSGIVLGGSGASRTVSLTPAANQHGSATITLTVSDGAATATTSFTLTVNPVNDAPTISSLSVPSIAEDASAGPVAFTVGDVETAAGSLTVTRSSSNTTLLPLSGIVLGGSGASRNVTLTPAANQHGSATVTLTVSDGAATATTSFTLTVTPVNDAPTISSISDVTIAEHTVTGPIAFTIGDVETAVGSLAVTCVSSNATLIPPGAIALGGSGANRTVSLSPPSGLSGDALITVSVSDGSTTASRSFELTVTSVNDAPTISSIGDQTIAEDTSAGPLSFTVGDPETAAASLVVTRTSSNTTLVPLAAIVLGGSGANRTVTATPVANQHGSATLTLTVSDGSASSSRSFLLTVNSVNDAPTIANVADRVLAINASTGAIPFAVGDVETAAASLAVTRATSNPALIPLANVQLGGSGASRTVTVVPALNQTGTAVITLSVADANGGTASDTFSVLVTDDTDADGIPNAVESLIGSNPNSTDAVGSVPALAIESPTL